jgi:uncharacterized protein (DUF1697 family)
MNAVPGPRQLSMTAKSASSFSYVALLRGINVGGKHILPMKDLVEVCSATKCENVRTYIQSGNVVFAASEKTAGLLAPLLARKIEERFGFPVPVILRSREQLEQVVRNNPFLKSGKPEKTLHVSFLADTPAPAAIQTLDPNRSAPDEFRVVGGEIYFYLPNGAGKSKLTNAYFDTRLATIGTVRNWATVLKLLAMTQA